MKKNLLLASAIVPVLYAGCAALAVAEVSIDIPKANVVDDFGYNYATGSYLTQIPSLHTAGLSFTYSQNTMLAATEGPTAFGGLTSPFNDGRGDQYYFALTRVQANKLYVFEGQSPLEFFGDMASNVYVGVNGTRGQVYCAGSGCIYTKADGTDVNFTIDFGDTAAKEYIKATVTTVKEPNGHILTYNFTGAYGTETDTRRTIEYCAPIYPDPGNTDAPGGTEAIGMDCRQIANPDYGKTTNIDQRKLAYITSTMGWTIRYGSTIAIINNTLEACDYTTLQCANNTNANYDDIRPKVSVSCSPGVCGYYDAKGKLYFSEHISTSAPPSGQPGGTTVDYHRIVFPSNRMIEMRYATSEEPYFSGYHIELDRISAGDSFRNYSFTPLFTYYDNRRVEIPYARTASWTNNVNIGKEIYIDTDKGIITSLKDELGRTTTYQTYDRMVDAGWKTKRSSNNTRVNLAGWVNAIVNPDATVAGDPTKGGAKLTYDVRGNITRKEVYPRGGGAPQVTTAFYPEKCSNWKVCNQPEWVRDPKGNLPENINNPAARTDYVYDPVHGGVIKQTGPVDGNGVRTQIRNTYAAKPATVLDTNRVPVTLTETPVYVLVRSSTCLEATAAKPDSCVTTDKELITSYEYNNNLMVSAKIDRAGNADTGQPYSATNAWVKTSYTYDYLGNQVIVDGPVRDADDRIFAVYDHRGRLEWEIGMDPDGTGPLKRQVTRHVFDADGREEKTEVGIGSNIAFKNGVPEEVTDFVVTVYALNTYNAAGLLIRTETVKP